MIQLARNKSLLTGFFAGHRVTQKFARGNISVADTTGIIRKCAGDLKIVAVEKILASNFFQ